jgi:hypothetical protein
VFPKTVFSSCVRLPLGLTITIEEPMLENWLFAIRRCVSLDRNSDAMRKPVSVPGNQPVIRTAPTIEMLDES